MSVIGRDESLDDALEALFEAFDKSGLTDLRWFVPFMEAVREAWVRAQQQPRGAVAALRMIASWPSPPDEPLTGSDAKAMRTEAKAALDATGGQ